MNNRLDLITDHQYVVGLTELLDACKISLRRYDDPRLRKKRKYKEILIKAEDGIAHTLLHPESAPAG